MSKFLLSFRFSYCFWSRNLDLKNQKCIWVRFHISNNMINIIDHLCKYWMGGVIYISDVNYSWIENHHSSFINSIHDLNFSVKFSKV